MTAPGDVDVFDGVVAAMQPLLHQHGFRRVEGMAAYLAPGTRHAAFASGQEAVRLVWEEGEGYVVLEALEPEFGGIWADMLLRRIDLRRAAEPELASLIQALREELTLYIQQVGPLGWRAS